MAVKEKEEGGRREPGTRSRGRFVLLLVIYVGIVAATIWAEYESYHIPMQGGEINGTRIFRFFTNDSNVLLALSCLCAIPAALGRLRGKASLGRRTVLLRYVATVSTGLTFWTVVLFLGPLFGYVFMYQGEDLYLHAIGPVLALLALIFLEREERLGAGAVLLSVVPMLVYGSVYVYQVVFAEHWSDFYGFVHTGHWMVMFGIMLGATALLGLVHAWLHNRFVEKKEDGRRPGKAEGGRAEKE